MDVKCKREELRAWKQVFLRQDSCAQGPLYLQTTFIHSVHWGLRRSGFWVNRGLSVLTQGCQVIWWTVSPPPLALIKCRLCSRNCSEHFTTITPFNPTTISWTRIPQSLFFFFLKIFIEIVISNMMLPIFQMKKLEVNSKQQSRNLNPGPKSKLGKGPRWDRL